jgi:hypothetical protein
MDSFRPHEVSVGQSVLHDDCWLFAAFAALKQLPRPTGGDVTTAFSSCQILGLI